MRIQLSARDSGGFPVCERASQRASGILYEKN